MLKLQKYLVYLMLKYKVIKKSAARGTVRAIVAVSRGMLG